MVSGTGGAPRNSVLYRIDRMVGFNARIEPYWKAFDELAPQMGFFEKIKRKGKTRKTVGSIDDALKAMGVSPDGWDGGSGECVCNLRVAKMGLVAELKRLARNVHEGDAAAKWPHLMTLRDAGAMVVPRDFTRPITVNLGRRREDSMVVISASGLKADLKSLDARLRVSETFAIKKMVDFLDATERDISIYESRFGSEEGFWAKFAFILLRKLADTALQHKLPAMLA